MFPVFFNGYGEWFIKDSNGQSRPHSELICYLEFDNYNRRWNRIYPHNKVIGLFMLTEEDEIKRNKKEQKHNNQGLKFDKFNLNFVNMLQPLPDGFSHCDVVKTPEPEIDDDSKYYFKIKKPYFSSDGYMEKSNYILEPADDLKSIASETLTKAENTANNLNKSDSTLDPRAETSYLLIIAALLEYISGKTPGIDKHPSFESESKLIEKIDKFYGEYRGISKRTLEDKFPKAKASLKDTLR